MAKDADKPAKQDAPIKEEKTENSELENLENETPTEHKTIPVWAAVLIGLAIGLFVILLLVRIGAVRNNEATISGTIIYNGLMPSSTANGSIVVEAKDIETDGDFAIVDQGIPISRGAIWSWETAQSGSTYQIRAYMEIEGNKVSISSSVVVTAPSENQKLVFNVTQDELDKFGIPSNANDNLATISGTLDINGFIPEGATVTILRKEANGVEYSVTKTGIPAVDGTALTWEAAQSGQTYDFVGILLDSQSTKIGQSNPLQITAPSTNNVLKIDSKATPPAPVTASISGTVQINGPLTDGSELVLKQRQKGGNEFQEFQRLKAANGVSWSLTGLESGTTYEITAALLEAGIEVSNGTVITASAPAQDEVIVVNVGVEIPAPTYAPTITCGALNGDTVNVLISVSPIDDALQYFLEIGIQPKAGDLFAEKIQNLDNEFIISPGQVYYTAYAYSFDSSCTKTGCFSALSPELAFQCPTVDSIPVPTPY
jgi:hypothetical protein